jgi:hypothetical protein
LTARGSELEREFPFGVVRQLFEPPLTDGEARERWLAGAAAPARAIFEAAPRRLAAVAEVQRGLAALALEGLAERELVREAEPRGDLLHGQVAEAQ